MNTNDAGSGLSIWVRRHPWCALWIVVVVVEAMLLANGAAFDTLLWRTTRWTFGDQPAFSWSRYREAHAQDATPLPFYDRLRPPLQHTDARGVTKSLYARMEGSLLVLKSFGENLTFIIIVLIVILLERRHFKAGIIVFVASLSADAIAFVLRIIAGRYRPDAPPLMDGINHWQLFRGFWDGQNLSFPSGHASAAFAIAAALTYLTPTPLRRRASLLFMIIATGTAISRVIMLAHFPSDVILGGAVGFTVSWHVAGWMDRHIADPLEQRVDARVAA